VSGVSAKATILIVEDNAMNMQLATDLLEVAGYRVVQATTAEEGITLALAERPELILMDVALPAMDGLAATRRLKQDARTGDIPVVALTAQAMAGDEARAREAGCAGYIAKPIATRRFASLVAGYLQQAAAGRPGTHDGR